MQIEINTDRNVEGREKLADHVKHVVQTALHRFGSRISRVEVHLSDEGIHKHGQDHKRCMMEARIEGRPPSAVTHEASTLDHAIQGAIDKLKRSVERTLQRLQDRS